MKKITNVARPESLIIQIAFFCVWPDVNKGMVSVSTHWASCDFPLHHAPDRLKAMHVVRGHPYII